MPPPWHDPPLPSSALICPLLAYKTITTMSTGSLLILCCLASAHVAAVAAVAVVAVGVIGTRSLIMAIEWEGSKLSFDALG
jgi:hypothetical protein